MHNTKMLSWFEVLWRRKNVYFTFVIDVRKIDSAGASQMFFYYIDISFYAGNGKFIPGREYTCPELRLQRGEAWWSLVWTLEPYLLLSVCSTAQIKRMLGLQPVLIFRHIAYNESATELIHARDPFIHEVRVTLVSLLMWMVNSIALLQGVNAGEKVRTKAQRSSTNPAPLQLPKKADLCIRIEMVNGDGRFSGCSAAEVRLTSYLKADLMLGVKELSIA